MYITDTTNNVRDFIESFDIKNDYGKMKVMMYIFEKVDNGQINSKNIANPNIGDNEDIEIFTFERIELTNKTCDILLQFFAMAFRELYKENVQYVDNHFIGLDYNEKDKIILSQFEKLSYNEKLDVISELVIRYNNNSMFKNQEIHIPFNDDVDGFELARLIQKLKI